MKAKDIKNLAKEQKLVKYNPRTKTNMFAGYFEGYRAYEKSVGNKLLSVNLKIFWVNPDLKLDGIEVGRMVSTASNNLAIWGKLDAAECATEELKTEESVVNETDETPAKITSGRFPWGTKRITVRDFLSIHDGRPELRFCFKVNVEDDNGGDSSYQTTPLRKQELLNFIKPYILDSEIERWRFDHGNNRGAAIVFDIGLTDEE